MFASVLCVFVCMCVCVCVYIRVSMCMCVLQQTEKTYSADQLVLF